MAGKRPNLKIDVTADTSKLSKGMKESKAAVKDFESSSSGALSKLGNMFGVNVDGVNKLVSATQGLGIKMSESGKTGVAAIGKLITSCSALNTAIAGIGIGGLIAGFKLLSTEAENFRSTVSGFMIGKQTDAYVSTYEQALHDGLAATGKWSAEEMSTVEREWKSGWARIRTAAVMTMNDINKSSPFGKSVFGGLLDFGKNLKSVNKDIAPQAEGKATKASANAGELAKLELELSDKSAIWAQNEADIANYKLIAYDKNKSLAVQYDAIVKAQDLIKQRFGEEASIRKQIADLTAASIDLTNSTPEEIAKANQLRVESINLEKSMSDALRELQERSASIRAEAEKEADARKRAKEEAEFAAKREKSQATADLIGSTLEGNQLSPALLKVPESGGIKVPVYLDTSPVQAEFNNLSDLMSEGVEVIADAFGALVGDIMTGGDAWGNFGRTTLSALGSIAVQVGKLAIATGVAALGIKQALKLSPWTAIAAGAALVALGAAVSAGLGNIGAGAGYSASAGVANADYNSSDRSSNSYGHQEINVNVTGTLKANGNALVAVINNEKNRTEHTT